MRLVEVCTIDQSVQKIVNRFLHLVNKTVIENF